MLFSYLSLGCFIVLQYMFASVLGHAGQKRLLLTDPDVAGHINQMAMNLQSLTHQVSQLTNSLNDVKLDFAAQKQQLTNSLNVVKSELTVQKQKNSDSTHQVVQLANSLNDVKLDFAAQKQQQTNSLNVVKSELAAQKQNSSGAGSTYTRWGRTTCSGSDTQLVYSGFTAGQNADEYSNRYGGPSNFLCLSNNPELSNLTTGGASHLFGTEFEEATLQTDAINEDIPCAVCKSVNTHISLMIPGRKTCYQGWNQEYYGLLASDHYGYSASSFICVDKQPEYVSGGQDNKDGRLLYFTSTKCGSLSCPPYKDNLAVNCVVCSQ